MGFLGKLLSSAVKLAVTPIAIGKDVFDTLNLEEADATEKLLKSSLEDGLDSLDDLSNGDLL